jgi:hypothetical protein
VDSLAAARHGERIEAHPAQHRAHDLRDLDALRQAGSLTGVEVEHESVRVLAGPVAAEPPLRNVDLERGDLREPDESREIVDERIVVDVVGMLDAAPLHPVRRSVVEVLLEEDLAGLLGSADAVHPALPGRGTVFRVRDQHVRDARVVVDDLGLGRPGLRVQHLVEVGQPKAVTAHGDVLFRIRHLLTLRRRGSDRPPLDGAE